MPTPLAPETDGHPMDYCEACQRQLNGAYNCPGCGTAYRFAAAPGRNRPTGDDDPVVVPTVETGRPRPSGGEEPDGRPPAPPGRPATAPSGKRRRALLLSAVMVCLMLCAVAVVQTFRGTPAEHDASTVVDTDPGTGTDVPAGPAVPSSTRKGTAPAPGMTGTTSPGGTGAPGRPGAGPPPAPGRSPGDGGEPDGTGGGQPSSPGPTDGTASPPGHQNSVVASTGACLTAGEAIGGGGTSVLPAPCDGSAAQTWYLTSDGALRSGAGDWCLDVVDARLDRGAPVQLFACNTTPAQVWVHDASRRLVNPQSGRCLDADGMTLQDCTGGAGQRWRMPTG
ncbi:RICIN domain-containing protein [Streptomyces sp. NPDC086010]|uniref:RICIN domain-containing protein n=1 Tax=Streptomyces sp. NPDC086010 TaxID=3365745 RepID=UPI0037CD9E94